MNKINFEPIGEAMKAFDTDKMDISRRMEIINPDGTTGETTTDTPLYTDIACHIAFVTSDNPDSKTADSQPIIVGIQINCPLEVDLQNGDYIIAKKLANSGEILETYKGIIGEPTVSQSRKSAEMKMETDL
jgi:hypothetical protein